MPDDINAKLQRFARRQRMRQLAILLGAGGLVMAFMVVILPRYYALNSNPLGQKFISAEVVSVHDVSSGTGVTYEVVARFEGFQKVFRTSDQTLIDALPDRLCIQQTRGVYIGEGVPSARYHNLADASQCDEGK